MDIQTIKSFLGYLCWYERGYHLRKELIIAGYIIFLLTIDTFIAQLEY